MDTFHCAKAEPHRPHVARSAITGRFRKCLGGPILLWAGDS